MRKRREQRPGQIGQHWLSKKPGRDGADDAWCRTWYESGTRQTCRVSLGTTDFQEASLLLAAWVVENERPRNAAPDRVLIETVLLNYWNDYAQHLPSARTQWLGLSYWQEFWTGRTVADITPHEQRRFREWLAGRGTGTSGIDRILSVGRAALNRARKWQELSEAPHIFGTVTAEAKRARKPKGRPITPEELARLIDAAQSRHMLLFLLIAANTLARPAAVLDLEPAQHDSEHGLLDLNPPGRVQNKKFRPVVPVSPTLRPWLSQPVGRSGRYVSYRNQPIRSILHMWRITREAAELDERVTPYSIRHGMAREMRKRRVPTEQISLFLGHLPDGSAATTSIYAPLRARLPGRCPGGHRGGHGGSAQAPEAGPDRPSAGIARFRDRDHPHRPGPSARGRRRQAAGGPATHPVRRAACRGGPADGRVERHGERDPAGAEGGHAALPEHGVRRLRAACVPRRGRGLRRAVATH
ncbi:tyrosine-type recombinase/integrase [Azospirillum sp. TSO22-1]|uniref:tyrosine-type recombinase/integrase n=1 Tax=Azospirillum sp. TSO22-1 TaxID=716789 RepID=UPI000D64C075|nr:tyrosine-type recombinase/integrase [Azospirillum sp. TSO22-1]